MPSSNQLRHSCVSVAFYVVNILPQNLIAHLERSAELLRPFFGVRKHPIDYFYDRIGCSVQPALQNLAFGAKRFEIRFPGNE